MAINLDERYPGRANPKTLDYPQGSFKNRSSPTAKDGTYLEQDWANDLLGFFQSLLKEAGIAANGVVDTAQASQYYDALIAAIRSQDASESQKGVVEIATAAEAQAMTDDTRVITPKKLAAAFGGANAGNDYQIWPGGLILQFGSGVTTSATADTPVTFPIAFPTGNISIFVSEYTAANPSIYSNVEVYTIVNKTNAGFNVGAYAAVSGNKLSGATFQWFAIGR